METSMGKMIYGLLTSLDGYIEAPEGVDSRWSGPDEELHLYFNEMQRNLALDIYGRRMYEVMRVWDTYDRDPSIKAFERKFAQLWQQTPKVVVSTTLQEVGPNARLVGGDVEAAARALKAQTDGDISVSGAELAASFGRWGLIDEYQLFVYPSVVGGGKPYFAHGAPLNLKPLGTERLPNDVVLLRYAPA
jgi:dihydrofolate reductase